MTDKSQYGWLIEAPGQNYLAVRKLGEHEFFWSKDHMQAIRFYSEQQADGVMMAVRSLAPAIFAFAVNLGDARPVEHGWMP